MKFRVLLLPVIAMMLAAPTLQAGERVPVVLELFTSEGCSSCPPADTLLASLAREQSSTAEIIVLGEHVDYWNQLGWKDRFSARQFSQRQEDFADRFGLGSVYTPQMVIDGHREFVGNDQVAVRKAIAAATQHKKPVEVALELTEGQWSVALRQTGTSRAAVLLAITEDNLATQVGAGENGGRQLLHQAVVRSMNQIGVLTGRSFTAHEALKLDPGWSRPNLKIVVLVQDALSGAIVGAAAQRYPAYADGGQ